MHNQCLAVVHSHHIATAPPAAVIRGREKNSTQMYPINTYSDGSLTLSLSRSHISCLHISQLHLQLANPQLKSSGISADFG